ncbi:MAG: diacylglycerol/lipid kinase family protein [Actinomycetota bacterium]
MRILLVVNSFATSVTPRNTVQVHQYLARHHDVQVVETSERGHATRFAVDAVARGLDAVIAFGGDGTLNEVATGLAGSEVALGVLPGGSTNVFARSLGMANDPLLAVTQLAAGFDGGLVSPIGLGEANGRYFTFHAGIGYDAEVVRQVERTFSFKRLVGQPLFAYSALKTWFVDYDRKFPHFTVEIDGRKIPNGFFAILLNTNPYTYVGKRAIELSRAASLEKRLVAVIFRRLSTPLMLSTMWSAFRNGGIAAKRGIEIIEDVEEVVFDFPAPFGYQLDGDYIDDTTTLTVRHKPESLRLIKPMLVEY